MKTFLIVFGIGLLGLILLIGLGLWIFQKDEEKYLSLSMEEFLSSETRFAQNRLVQYCQNNGIDRSTLSKYPTFTQSIAWENCEGVRPCATFCWESNQYFLFYIPGENPLEPDNVKYFKRYKKESSLTCKNSFNKLLEKENIYEIEELKKKENIGIASPEGLKKYSELW